MAMSDACERPNAQDDRAAANHPTIIEDRDRRVGPSASSSKPLYVLFVTAKALPIPHRRRCPHCGGPLAYVGLIPQHDWPFAPYDTS